MNRSNSLTGPQQAKVNEYKAMGYVIDQSASGESVEMTRGAQRIAICWNGTVKALGGEMNQHDRDSAELRRLCAERDRLKRENNDIRDKWKGYADELEAERDRARAEIEALKTAFGECVNSLHCEMLQKFGGQKPEDMHPVTRRDYDRDMAEIAEYRSIVEASK